LRRKLEEEERETSVRLQKEEEKRNRKIESERARRAEMEYIYQRAKQEVAEEFKNTRKPTSASASASASATVVPNPLGGAVVRPSIPTPTKSSTNKVRVARKSRGKDFLHNILPDGAILTGSIGKNNTIVKFQKGKSYKEDKYRAYFRNTEGSVEFKDIQSLTRHFANILGVKYVNVWRMFKTNGKSLGALN
jgi:hypothetical protein